MGATRLQIALVLLVAPSAAFRPPTFAAHQRSAVCLYAPAPMLRSLSAPPARALPLAVATSADEKQLDVGALGRYAFAVLIQMILISTSFGFIDLYSYGPLPGDVQLGGQLPWQVVVGIFLGMSVRSRLFSPLDNSRPELRASVSEEDDLALKELISAGQGKKPVLKRACEQRGLQVDYTLTRAELLSILDSYFDDIESRREAGEAADEKLMPGWTPPGVVFPIMWVLVVAPLRAFASALVYETSTGRLNEAHLNDPVLLCLMLHLCIGDTWNTANNVERRVGAAVPGVALVWLSTLFAAKQYYDVLPLAGLLLGATAVWIAVAGALVADTWRINNDVSAEPLYPYKREGSRSLTRLRIEP
jgi:translocator protein